MVSHGELAGDGAPAILRLGRRALTVRGLKDAVIH